MELKPINLRIDLMHSENNKAKDTYLGRFFVPQVPIVGELVNVNGDPYRVIERSWAMDNSEVDLACCYIRVGKLWHECEGK